MSIEPIPHERGYATKHGLKSGLISAGLGALKYDARPRKDGKLAATVYVRCDEDRHYVNSKGFTAVVDPGKAAH